MFGKKYLINGVKYELIKKKSIMKVVKGSKIASEIILPAEVDGFPVQLIGENAFNGFKELASVTLPDSITDINNGAFGNCINLKSIEFSNNLTFIGSGAFKKCVKLSQVTFPDNLQSIGMNAFEGCSSLSEINIPDGVTSIGGFAFHKCQNATKLTIGKGLPELGYGVFANCTSLAQLTIPGNVKKLYNTTGSSDGVGTFQGCVELTEVIIEEGMLTIGNSAFYGCKKLEKAVIPRSVTLVDWVDIIGRPEKLEMDRRTHAFAGCPELTIYGYKGTGAHTYSKKYSMNSLAAPIPFVDMEDEISVPEQL